MRREARLLHEKSLGSLVLAVEHFNRTTDRGRVEAVLILLDRAFELLLKAAIVHKGGRIRESRAKETGCISISWHSSGKLGARLPVGLPGLFEKDTAQSEQGVEIRDIPAHPRPFDPRSRELFSCTLNRA